MSSSHQNASKYESKWFKCESQIKDLPQYVPILGMCAGGIYALQQMCLVLKNSPHIQDVPFASGYSAVPSGMLQSGTGRLDLSGMNAPEQPFMSCRWELLERFLKSLSFYLGNIWATLFSVFPKVQTHLFHALFWISSHVFLVYLLTSNFSWDCFSQINSLLPALMPIRSQ